MFYPVLSVLLCYIILCSIMFYSNDRSKQAICRRQLYFCMTRIKHQFRHQNIVGTWEYYLCSTGAAVISLAVMGWAVGMNSHVTAMSVSFFQL